MMYFFKIMDVVVISTASSTSAALQQPLWSSLGQCRFFQMLTSVFGERL